MSSDHLGWVTIMVTIVLGPQICTGRGRLLEPPARSSMWRRGFPTPINYNDNSLNCGGRHLEWAVFGGKCGLCGDPWNQPVPRENEDGGKYGTGLIARNYTAGQDISVTVEISANILGWFEFSLCARDSNRTVLTQECLDQNPLELADGTGRDRYPIAADYSVVQLKLRLPAGVTCAHCVLQWKWHGSNSRDAGDEQEEFYGCSDIAVQGTSSNILTSLTSPSSTQTSSSFLSSPVPGSTVSSIGPSTGVPGSTVPTKVPSTAAPSTVPSSAVLSTAGGSAPTGSSQCHAVGLMSGNSEFDEWCKRRCRPQQPCNPAYCDPSCNSPSPSPRTSLASATPSVPESTEYISLLTTHETFPTVCYGINRWHGVRELDEFCSVQCLAGKCLPPFCSCLATQSGLTDVDATFPHTSQATIHLMNSSGLTTPMAISHSTEVTGSLLCYAIGSWSGIPLLDQWCQETCSQYDCNKKYCACSHEATKPSLVSTSESTLVATSESTLVHTSESTLVYSTDTAAPCYAIGAFKGLPLFDLWCAEICNKNNCNAKYCACDWPSSTVSPLISSVSSEQITCYSTKLWGGVSPVNDWCVSNCAIGICPPEFCECGPVTVSLASAWPMTSEVAQRTTEASTTTPTTAPPSPTTLAPLNVKCHAVGSWQGVPELEAYCTAECPNGFCEPNFCRCDP